MPGRAGVGRGGSGEGVAGDVDALALEAEAARGEGGLVDVEGRADQRGYEEGLEGAGRGGAAAKSSVRVMGEARWRRPGVQESPPQLLLAGVGAQRGVQRNMIRCGKCKWGGKGRIGRKWGFSEYSGLERERKAEEGERRVMRRDSRVSTQLSRASGSGRGEREGTSEGGRGDGFRRKENGLSAS